jgi:N-methylhydantoinase A
MAENIKVVSVKRGFDPRDFALVAFGGAGPTHAGALLDDLQLPAVLVPREPGTLSALGLLTADLRSDYVRTFLRRADAVRADELKAHMEALEEADRHDLAQDGVPAEATSFERAADMRYAGQAYELTVAVDDVRDIARMVQAFHAEHDRLFAHRLDGASVELVALRLAAVGKLRGATAARVAAGGPAPPRDALRAPRCVYFEEVGGWGDSRDRTPIPCSNHVASQAGTSETGENSASENADTKKSYEEPVTPRNTRPVLITQRSLVQIQPPQL